MYKKDFNLLIFRHAFILILLAFFSCEKKTIPDSLETAFDYLDKNWNDDQRLLFSALKHKEYAPVYYGYDIENEIESILLKNHPVTEQLNLLFDSLGIYHNQDKSGIILNSYFDYINDKPIDLQNQVKIVLEYWNPIDECIKHIKEKAFDTYKSFEKNDIITILLPVEEHDNATDYICPDYTWNYKEGQDLKITAVVIDKFMEMDSLNASFKLKLHSKSSLCTDILCQEIYIGGTINISLYNSWKISNLKK